MASEMKALAGRSGRIEELPPGSYLDSAAGEIRRYYRPAWRHYDAFRATTRIAAAISTGTSSWRKWPASVRVTDA